MLKSIQLDNKFIPVTDSNLPELKEQLQNKELIVFNAPFEQTQLSRAGFDVGSNHGLDVSLLTKLYDNRLAEARIASLGDLEERILGETTKNDLVIKLESKYGKNFFNHPDIVSDPLFQEYGTNDTKITRALGDMLKNTVPPGLFQSMQTLQDKLTQGAMKGIPFPRKKLEAAQQELKLSRKESLEKIVDIRFLDKSTKAGLKGGNSSKLKSLYISTYKQEGLKYLKITPTGKVRFDREARDELIELFPNDKVLQSVYEPFNMKTAIQQIDKLLVYADRDVLYPNYNLLGAATGRFKVAQPELQNLVANKNYNVRDLFLGAENVFTIDFASQEPRMSALRAKEKCSIEDFIADKNHHSELAKNLGITRPQAKRVGLGLFYGMGHERLADTLSISNSEAIRIKDTFRQKYATTFNFIEELSYLDEETTPLLSRRIRFSEGMGKHTKFNGLIQSSCVDLLLVALEYVLASNKVELRAHIHDSLYLACLCKEPHPNCKQARKVVQELEALYPFFWPGTEHKVLKFGEIIGTTS